MRSLVLTAFLVSCNKGTVAGDGTGATADADTDTDTDTDTDVDADTHADTDPLSEPCFETDIVPLFERSCGTGDDSCHSPVAYGPTAANACEGWLSLTNEPLGGDGCPPMPLYERLTVLHGWACLINGAAESNYDPLVWNYVTPGDPDTSVLYQKVAPDGILCSLGDGSTTQRMPIGVPLPAEEVELIRTWIELGAKAGDECEGATPPSTTGPVPNAIPVVVINHPGNGEIRQISDGPFPFIATAEDAEDGNLTASLTWTSSLDGPFGTGSDFDYLPQPVGTHVITASVTDSSGAIGEASVTVEMVP